MPIKRYVDLSGGQNNQVNQFLVQDNESTLVKNATLETVGAVTKSVGYLARGASQGANPILGIYEFRKNSTETRYPFVGYGSNLYAFNLGTNAYTSSATVVTANKKMRFETFLNTVFFVNGVDPNVNGDGTGGGWSNTNYIYGLPVFGLIKKWHEGMFAAGNPSKKSRVWLSDKPTSNDLKWGWWSGTDLLLNAGSVTVTSASGRFKFVNIKPGDTLRVLTGNNVGDYIVRVVVSDTELTLATPAPNFASGQTYEVGSNWFEVGQDDGDVITALGENSDRLMIWKEQSLYRFDGNAVQKVADVGTPCQEAVQNIERYTLFANRKGIYVYDGVETTLISKKIKPFFDAIPEASLPNMTSWVEGDLYYLSIGTVTVNGKLINNCVVVYDISQNNLSVRSFRDSIRAAGKILEGTKVKTFLGTDGGLLLEFGNGTTYKGDAIDFEFITKNHDLDDPEGEKQVNAITVFGNKLEGMKVYIQPDDGEIIPLDSLQGRSATIQCNVQGMRFRLLFGHTETSVPVIEGYSFDYERIKGG